MVIKDSPAQAQVADKLVWIATVLTAPETGDYDFFVRSDDASQLFLNQTGPSIPIAWIDAPIAEETGSCDAFKEPGAPETTATPISLQAGNQYGILFLVKEGSISFNTVAGKTYNVESCDVYQPFPGRPAQSIFWEQARIFR